MVEAAKRAYVYDVLPRETISGMTGRQVPDAIVDGRLPQAPISQVLNFWLGGRRRRRRLGGESRRRIFSIPWASYTAVGL